MKGNRHGSARVRPFEARGISGIPRLLHLYDAVVIRRAFLSRGARRGG